MIELDRQTDWAAPFTRQVLVVDADPTDEALMQAWKFSPDGQLAKLLARGELGCFVNRILAGVASSS
jgi:hypothetical protein